MCHDLSKKRAQGRILKGLPKIILDSEETFGPITILIDSGSEPSLISSNNLRTGTIIRPVSANVKTISGSALNIIGQAYVTLKKGFGNVSRHRFLVTDASLPGFDAVIGTDWMSKHQAKIDYKQNAVYTRTWKLPFIHQHSNRRFIISSNVNTKDVTRNNCEKKVISKNGQVEKVVCFVATRKYVIPPFYHGEVPVRLSSSAAMGSTQEKRTREKKIYYCESASNNSQKHEKYGLRIGRAVFHEETAAVPVVNLGTKTIVIKKGSDVANGRVMSAEEMKVLRVIDAAKESENVQRINALQNDLSTRKRTSYSTTRPSAQLGIQRSKVKETEGERIQLFSRSRVRGRRPQLSKEKKDAVGVPPRAKHDQRSRSLNPQQTTDTVLHNIKPRMRGREKEKESRRAHKFEVTGGLEELIKDVVSKSECPPHLQPQLGKLLREYSSVLGQKTEELGLCKLYEPSIPLDTTKVVYTPQYPVPQKMRAEMTAAVKEFIDAGIVQLSSSPFNSPTIMVPKKDGGYRLVVDFRKLNTHVISDPHPLPRIAQILEELGTARYFTAIDLLWGFYNLKIQPEERYKTAFSTPDGHYEFVRLPMGLKNSPAIFQRVMNMVLSGTLGKFAFIYIDDVVVYSRTAEEHLQHLDNIFNKLRHAGLKVKFSKCQLFKTSIDYLGFVIGKDGLQVNPAKVSAISQFPTPTTEKAVRAFLGMVGYFRTFIKDFSTKAAPLYHLLKEDGNFNWTPACDKAISVLKHALTTAPILAFPDFDKPFYLTTDASGYAIGAWLTQKVNKKEVLIGCTSRTLRGSEVNYTNVDREILAVRNGIKQFRSYLWGNPFVIRTDNKAIIHIAKNTTTDNQRALRWHLDFCEYTYTVEHRKGSSIRHADALSRYPANMKEKKDPHAKRIPAQISAFLSPGLQNQPLEPEFDLDSWKTILSSLENVPTGDQWKKVNGLTYHLKDKKLRLWVPPQLRLNVLKAYHDPPAQGHCGRDKMQYAMEGNVFWNKMIQDIKEYVNTCETCQRAKHYQHKTPWQNTPIPGEVFEDVSLDVVGPVPTSLTGKSYILVVQDRLSRWIKFSPMRDTSAEVTARTFLNDWVCVYGVPKRIITDRGTNFTSRLFATMNEFLGIQHGKTTAYRPTSNGQNERSHRDLHKYLSMYLTHQTIKTWDTLLQHAGWVHNSSLHDALQMSPYEVVYGIKPNTVLPTMETDAITKKYFGVDSKRLHELREHARTAIAKGQAGNLQRLNLHTKPTTFKPGDLVLIRDHRENTSDKERYEQRKWSYKYIGPKLVLEVVNPVVLKITDANQPSRTKTDLVHTAYVRPFRIRDSQLPSTKRPSNVVELEQRDEEQTQLTESVQGQAPSRVRVEIDNEDAVNFDDDDNQWEDDNDEDNFEEMEDEFDEVDLGDDSQPPVQLRRILPPTYGTPTRHQSAPSTPRGILGRAITAVRQFPKSARRREAQEQQVSRFQLPTPVRRLLERIPASPSQRQLPGTPEYQRSPQQQQQLSVADTPIASAFESDAQEPSTSGTSVEQFSRTPGIVTRMSKRLRSPKTPEAASPSTGTRPKVLRFSQASPATAPPISSGPAVQASPQSSPVVSPPASKIRSAAVPIREQGFEFAVAEPSRSFRDYLPSLPSFPFGFGRSTQQPAPPAPPQISPPRATAPPALPPQPSAPLGEFDREAEEITRAAALPPQKRERIQTTRFAENETAIQKMKRAALEQEEALKQKKQEASRKKSLVPAKTSKPAAKPATKKR